MVIISLILGVILGGITVVFALQNTAEVTLSFFAWQTTAPLAFFVLSSALMGVAITLLSILPRLIVEEFEKRALKREKRIVEDSLAKTRAQAAQQSSSESAFA